MLGQARLDYDPLGLCNPKKDEIAVKNNAWALVLLVFAVLWSDGCLAAAPLGAAEQARAMLERAAVAIKADQGAALQAFNDAGNKSFHDRDLFVYCFNTSDGKFTAYEMSALIGADIRKFKLYNEPMDSAPMTPSTTRRKAPSSASTTGCRSRGRKSHRPRKPSKRASATGVWG